MTKPDPKTTPAFAAGAGHRESYEFQLGLTQYAYVAAQFHSHLVTQFLSDHKLAAEEAFDHADAFFAELAKRTS